LLAVSLKKSDRDTLDCVGGGVILTVTGIPGVYVDQPNLRI